MTSRLLIRFLICVILTDSLANCLSGICILLQEDYNFPPQLFKSTSSLVMLDIGNCNVQIILQVKKPKREKILCYFVNF